MPVRKLIDFLRENHVKFVVISHSPAYTALEIAESAHVPGQVLAKTVMIDIDGTLAMAVLPASKMINLEMLKESLGAKNVILSCEQEFARRFPGCELGAMPPFGNLFGMDVYVSPELAEDDEIAFNAGSLSELILLSYEDYVRLVNPKIVNF